jgi:hypothetical protein
VERHVSETDVEKKRVYRVRKELFRSQDSIYIAKTFANIC